MFQKFCAVFAFAFIASCGDYISVDSATNADTDTNNNADIMSVDVFVPQCAVNNDCDDGEPCTIELCLGMQCYYKIDDQNKACVSCKESGDCADYAFWPCEDDKETVHIPVDCFHGACQWKKIELKYCDHGCGDFGRCAECASADDCNDYNECTNDTCQSHNCSHDPMPIYTPCDDDVICTNASACNQYGACKGWIDETQNWECDDNDACTFDECNTPLNKCSHNPTDCDDKNPCTTDSCNTITGNCLHTNITDGTTCNDMNGCTNGSVCMTGTCSGAIPWYQPEVSGTQKLFKCLTCQTDLDCSGYTNAIACPTLTPGPVTQVFSTVVEQFTGKCVKNNCETVEMNCSDGDPSTWDSCSTSQVYDYPMYVLGTCVHPQPIGQPPTEFNYTECWCSDVNYRCVTTNGGITITEIKTPCANGCGASGCL